MSARNVGQIDRILRIILGLLLIWLGLVHFGGIEGDLIGILVALTAVLPIYMSITASCIVFKWFGIHSLTKTECKKYGNPYSSDEK